MLVVRFAVCFEQSRPFGIEPAWGQNIAVDDHITIARTQVGFGCYHAPGWLGASERAAESISQDTAFCSERLGLGC